jgi:type I restriction enzyme, S subunit
MKASWPKVRLGEVLQRSEELVTPTPGSRYRELTVRLWGRGVVERGRSDSASLAGSRRYLARSGQFIASRIDARNGAMGIVPDELDGALVSNDFPLFNLRTDRLMPSYFGWLSRTQGFVESCQKASEGTTNRVRLKEDRFLALDIPLPPLAEQRRLVARIEGLAAHIHEARDLRSEAAEQAEALFRASIEMTYRGLRDRLGSLCLADVCETITDGDHNTPAFTDTGVRFIFVGNVSTGRLHFGSNKRVAEQYFKALSPRRVPVRGDILYSAVGATGIPAVVDTDEPFCFQRHVAILKPNRSLVDSQFVCHILRSRTVFETAWRSTTGSAQPTVPLRSIRQLQIPVPPLADQRRIAADLDRLHAEVDAVKRLQAETAAHLAVLLPAVLDCAFTGELRRCGCSYPAHPIETACRTEI